LLKGTLTAKNRVVPAPSADTSQLPPNGVTASKLTATLGTGIIRLPLTGARA
jgi:hypothetical protein